MTDKPIASVALAPVVSVDNTSKESQLARQAKEIQLQANTDSAFDTKLERFCGGAEPTLVSLAVALTLLFVSKLVQRRK